MKTIRRFLITLLSLAALTACEKDGDLITLSGLEKSELMVTVTDVVLTQETSSQNALSVAWSTSTLTVSDPSMSAPTILETTLQVSKTEDFSGTLVESVESNLSRTYTGAELNTVAKTLETEPSVATPVYFRLKASVGDNMDPVYSNVVSVNVTSYVIDMSVGFILNADQEDTGLSLYSADSNGEYTGFMGAAGWSSFFLKEGDGTIWGNDGVSGTAFVLSSEDDSDKRWNCWFPGISGCYYVDFNTNTKVWSALSIPALTVSGDISGEMTFDRSNVKWTIPFTATSTSVTVKISGSGKLYDNSTGDAAAIDAPVAFAQSDGNLALADQAGDLSIAVPSAGEYTLTINLSNPKSWTIEAVAGSTQPVVVSPYVYLPGISDGSGDWTFNKSLALYNEDDLAYAGVVEVNCDWGYTINPEKDNWSDKYTLDSGDASSGTLAYQGENNIPAPAPGLYLIDTSLKGLTYNLIGVGDQIYVSGLNNVWDFSVSLAVTGTVGTYSGSITINSASSSGFQILLNSSVWTEYYGGSSGNLYYKGSNITDDASLAAGTYTLTVNLLNGTYSITQ